MGANKGLMEDSFSELKAASSDGRNTKDNGKGTPLAPTCWENISLQSERKLYKSTYTPTCTHTPKLIYKGGKKSHILILGFPPLILDAKRPQKGFVGFFPYLSKNKKNFKEERKRKRSSKDLKEDIFSS